MNTWRQMMIWGAPFLLPCSLWIGITRRKSIITLLTALVVNATLLAIVGIVARFTAPAKVLWLVNGIKDYCFASFIYKNHAGSFFALAVGLALALAVHLSQPSRATSETQQSDRTVRIHRTDTFGCGSHDLLACRHSHQ
ncbi:MAG: hypothetical protein J6386_06750 [Candidatus Synoicihabitans palmerolidicus]|nr:hypothetical protein [Candidatus Synoicihabitans palmerolidicus]